MVRERSRYMYINEAKVREREQGGRAAGGVGVLALLSGAGLPGKP